MRFLALLALCAVPAAAQEIPTPFTREKVRVLLREQLPCLGCHEFEGQGGRVGPSLTDVHRRRDAAYIRAMVESPRRVVPSAAMPLTAMPASTREALIRVLSAGAPPGRTLIAAQAPLPALTPRDLYQKWCASCHGVTGKGDGTNASHLPVRPAVHASREAMSARPDDALYDVIAAGGLAMGKSARMPAFGESLSRREIRQLVAYIRQLCDCTGPAWSRDPEWE